MKTTQANESIYQVILSPVVTEKATTLSEGMGKVGVSYVFNVAADATKPQIKKAVEKVFSVNVKSVRVSNLKGKKRNVRHRGGGSRPGYKPSQRRAYVRVGDNQNIDILNFGGGSK